MRRIIAAFVLLCLALALPAAAESDADGWRAEADAIMAALADGAYDGVLAEATDEMRAALTADAMAEAIGQLGAIERWTALDASEQSGYRVARYAVEHAGGASFTHVLSLDADNRLAGWRILPPEQPAAEPAPESGARQETVLFRAGQADETPAVLTLPEGDGPFPAAILTPGSGPCDRDETAYGIRPFRDIAEGLAAQGIATIRWDKYTYLHADQIADVSAFTVSEEYTPDVRAALEALEADGRIGKIFLLGHSQGGMLMPRLISELGPERFAGGISLGGTPLHMWQIQLHQNEALLDQLPEEQRGAARAQIDAELEKLDELPGWTEGELRANTVFGIGAYYQWDEMRVEPAEAARANGLPVLALQGGADWQVTPEDGAEQWRRLLPEADVVVLDGLSHVFTEVENPTGTPADYASGSHVSQRAIDAVAEWILSRAAPEE